MDSRINAATYLAGTDEVRTMTEPARMAYFGTNMRVYKYYTQGVYRYAIEDTDGIRWGYDRDELEQYLIDLYRRESK